MQAEIAAGMTEPTGSGSVQQEPAIVLIVDAGEASADSDVNDRMLDRLLAMAHQYRSEGNLRQAMEMYWALLETYPGTAQAQGACEGLLELADSYERNGTRHAARAIYERLL